MFNLIIMETQKQQRATWKTIKTKCREVIRIEHVHVPDVSWPIGNVNRGDAHGYLVRFNSFLKRFRI